MTDRRHRPRAFVVAVAVLTAACSDPQPTDMLRVSGHVEATEVQVASEVGGRILEMRVAEGDRLSLGQTIAKLDTRDTELQVQRARAERAAADAQLRLLLAGARSEDIRQAEAQVQSAEGEAKAIEADLQSATLDLQRFESLLAANAGSRKQRDDAQARVDVTRERLRSATERVQSARETLARLQSGARREEVDAARARVASVDAQLATLRKALDDAVITAPAAGIVTQRLAEAGELVRPGVPTLVITDLDHAWANLFVPEPMVPRIRVAQPATVFTDAGGPGIAGTVTFISPNAEFTPRNVQTAEERSKLVYRIKVTVDNSAGILKPGMPVDAELRVQ